MQECVILEENEFLLYRNIVEKQKIKIQLDNAFFERVSLRKELIKMNQFIEQCFSILESNYKLERIINESATMEHFYRLKDKYYVLFFDGILNENLIPEFLEKIEKIYRSFMNETMYILVIGKTLNIMKGKDCLWCFDWNCYVDLFLYNETEKCIITNKSLNIGDPNFRPIIKNLAKNIAI